MAYADNRDEILSRLRPIGRVQVEGVSVDKDLNHQMQSVKTVDSQNSLSKGLAVYRAYCIACHQQGLLGAPKVHNEKDWGPRKKQGIDTLLQHVSQGYKAMPPKGTCFRCHDEDLKAAIYYMMKKDD